MAPGCSFNSATDPAAPAERGQMSIRIKRGRLSLGLPIIVASVQPVLARGGGGPPVSSMTANYCRETVYNKGISDVRRAEEEVRKSIANPSRIRPLITNPRGSPGSPRLLRRRRRALFARWNQLAGHSRAGIGGEAEKDEDREARDHRDHDEGEREVARHQRRVAEAELDRAGCRWRRPRRRPRPTSAARRWRSWWRGSSAAGRCRRS